MEKSYLCIDLKSFYASVECVERGLDPFEVNLVVADPTRRGAITLAATPAIKKLGVPSRGRIYEIPKGIEYICAPPRMSLYMTYSAKIYSIYLRYLSKEDIHVYSIDECFMDVTDYLSLYDMSAKEMAVGLMDAVMKEAHFKIPSTTDYNGVYKGKYIDFEAKETKSVTSFNLNNIHKHQIIHLKRIVEHGGIGFLIIRFTVLNKTYLIEVNKILEYIDNHNRKSIPLDYIENFGYIIVDKYNPIVDYLEIVDKLILKENKYVEE